MSANRALRQQCIRGGRAPSLDALALDEGDDRAVQFRGDDRLVALLAQENRNGHVPDLLPADAPVGARGDHIGDTHLPPGRIPDHLVDLLDSELAKSGFRAVGAAHRGFHADEPLLRGAEDYRLVAAPAVGIGVLKLRAAQQRAAFFEHGDDDRIRLPHGQTVVSRWLGTMPGIRIEVDVSAGIDAGSRVEAVALAGQEVVGAVGGCGVDRASACVGRNVGGQHAQDRPLKERMLESDAVEDGSLEAGELFGGAELAGCGHLLGQCSGHEVDFAGFDFQRHVIEIRVECHGQRRGQRPRGGSPDDGRNLPPGKRGRNGGWIGRQPVAHVNRRAGVVLVLDFCLGQRCAVVDAPVNRFEPAVDEAFFEEAIERLKSAGLVIVCHGFIGLVPTPEAANALKLRGLHVDILLRVGTAGLEYLRHRQLQPFAAKLLFHFDLDRQPVAVVAGDKGGVEPGHGFGLDHEVLEALVEGMAQVDGPVGVGRAVVQQVDRPSAAGFAHLFIETELGPSGQPKRLILRQIGFHCEGGLRQGKGRLQLRRRGHRDSVQGCKLVQESV